MHNDLGKQLSLSDTIDQFTSAMLEQGIETSDEIIADGKLHRFHVTGDARGSKNGFYKLHADFPPNGSFGCNKRFGSDQIFRWKPDHKTDPMSPEERKAFAERVAQERANREAATKARYEAAAAAANALWSASAAATDDHPYLTSKGIKAHGLRVGRWEKINKETGEVRLISDKALLVPINDRTRTIHSLQAIFPSKLKIMGDRNKDYMTDGAKRGLFHTIGTRPLVHDGKPVFVLCEGYATGASIHECSGHLTLVCFDAGNIPAVADEIKKSADAKGVEYRILIAADNDRWTTEPRPNPGVYHATQAAKAVGGLVAIPDFIDLSGEPTDFNDLHQREGAEVVASAIAKALNPPADAEDDAPWGDEPAQAEEPASEAPAAPAEPVNAEPQKLEQPKPDENELDDQLSRNGYFLILGYNGKTYFIFHQEKKQVISVTKADLRGNGLSELAPLQWWEENFPGDKGVNEKQAANWFFRIANARGMYDPSRSRGRGAWSDKGRFVYHMGDHLIVDGEKTALGYLPSAYVYPMGPKIKLRSDEVMTEEEGRHLLKVAEMVRWTKPASAALMAGWTMLAPICGALRWRPHIWLTGAAGSGKSTIQNHYVSALTAGVNVYAQGNSTEAGIRQKLTGDALPVLIDEAESNNERERVKMENIMAMIRQSSSESQAQTLKGTAYGETMIFNIRSMFCLASINTNTDKKADHDRLTKLIVRPPKGGEKENKQWLELKEELHKIHTDDAISSRLMNRAIKMLPVILHNIEVFTRVSSQFFGTQREGDQLGAMAAGAWSMCNDAPVTEDEAVSLLNRYEWSEHTEDNDLDDSQRALNEVMNAKIRVGGAGDMTVGELAMIVSSNTNTALVTVTEATRMLKQHGMMVLPKDRVMLFGTSVPNLKKLVDKTSFATDLRGQLTRLPGATKHNDKTVRFHTSPSKCVSIPLSLISSDDEDEPPI